MSYLEYNDIEETKKLTKTEMINNYLYFEVDNIFYLHHNITHRFSLISPFFLDLLTTIHLSDLFIHLIFGIPLPTPSLTGKVSLPTPSLADKVPFEFNSKLLPPSFVNLFKNFYHKELHMSYDIVCKYLKLFKTSIQYEDWILFCIKYTNLSEIQNCD